MKVQDFRDYHLLLDEQAKQIFAITDNVGARAQDWRNALPSIGDMSHHQGSRTNPVRRMKMKA
jgi:DNA-binding ferritin-like protein